jgi:hypothetical protein
LERVEFVLGFSKLLFVFLGMVYITALIILTILPIPILLKIAGTTLLVAYFSHLLHLHIIRISKKSVVLIWQDAAGGWGAKTEAGKVAVGFLKGDSFKSAVVLILRFRFKSGVKNVIVPVDALNQAEYRILCARLDI